MMECAMMKVVKRSLPVKWSSLQMSEMKGRNTATILLINIYIIIVEFFSFPSKLISYPFLSNLPNVA